MYSPKDIIHIVNYDFGNGQPVKNRYFIVLGDSDGLAIVLSVVTTTILIPEEYRSKGCNNQPEIRFHCYGFNKHEVIGEQGFSFGKDCFVNFGSSNIFSTESANLKSKYNNDIQKKDVLIEKEYGELLYCLFHSKHLQRRYKPLLQKQLELIYGEL